LGRSDEKIRILDPFLKRGGAPGGGRTAEGSLPVGIGKMDWANEKICKIPSEGTENIPD